MNRAEFLKQLEYLLQDMPEDEREDAVAYYRDYFEEAGPDQEAAVLRELGSPERIAAMIRADWNGQLKGGGEFTDSGYQDERYREPGRQMVKRPDFPETEREDGADGAGRDAGGRRRHSQGEGGGAGAPSGRGGSGGEEFKREDGGPESRGDRWGKAMAVGLLIFLAVLAAPVLLGLGSGVMGLAAALVSLVFALLLGLAAGTFVCLLIGIVLTGVGIMVMTGELFSGIMSVGVGVSCLGLGCLGLALCLLFYGKLLPAVLRRLAGALRLSFGGRKRG